MVDRDFALSRCVPGRYEILAEAAGIARTLSPDIDCAVDPEDAPRDDDYSKAYCRGALFDLAAEASKPDPFMLIEAPRRSRRAASPRSTFVRAGDLRPDSLAFSANRLFGRSCED